MPLPITGRWDCWCISFDMKKIVVIGANGFTGRRLLQQLAGQEGYEVYGVSLNADRWPTAGYRFVTADITVYAAISSLLGEIRPDAVVNTSALSVPDYCELHHDEAYAVNVSAVEHLAACCARLQSRFIHLSTDFVFSGHEDRLYTEDDLPAPVNYYGHTKWLGEQAALAACSNAAVARVVVVYGRALPGQHGNIFQLVKTRLEAGQPIRVVSDQWRTPTWVDDVATGLRQLLPFSGTGLYHLCGDECLTIADIAYRVAGFFHLDHSLIQPVTTAEMNEATPRPLHSGLSNRKACRDFSFRPHSLVEGMREL